MSIAAFFLALGLPTTLQAQQGGCVYRYVGGKYLCVAIPGASSSQPPIVPDNTAVSDGNTTYYGDGFAITPTPGVTYIPGYDVTPFPISTQVPTRSPSPSPSQTLSSSPPPSPITCNGGPCCTPQQLLMGMACTVKNASAGCGCPVNWSCSYLGRNNTDGSQTIQCLPPVNGGIPIGQTCSPAGAPCAPYNAPDGEKYEADCGFNSGNYVCLNTGIPLAGTSQSTTTNTGGTNTGIAGGINTGIAGGITCDPVEDGHIDQNDFNVWKQEYLHTISTTRSACMSPNNAVDLLGFQAWKNIAVLHTKTNFNQ